MEIKKTKNNDELDVVLTGRLDTNTAPELIEALTDEIPGLSKLVIDMAGLEYVSSAGLRALLQLQKKCDGQKTQMDVINVNDVIMDVFKMTGFNTILNIIS